MKYKCSVSFFVQYRSEKSVQKYKVASSEIQKRVAAVLDPPKENLVPYET